MTTRESDSHEQLMEKWAESHRTGQLCSCQKMSTDARECPRHGAQLREKGES